MLEKLKVALPGPYQPNQENMTNATPEPPKINYQEELGEAIRLNPMNLPGRFINKTLMNFHGFEREKNECLSVIANRQSLFLTGLCGRGKTHLAIGLAYDSYVKNIRYEYVTLKNEERKDWKKSYPKINMELLPSVEFFFELKNSFAADENQYSETDIINYYSKVEFLIIDDVGAEKVSDWSRQVFYLLIDRRYRMMKQTIITSNLDMNELSKTIDDRIASRILEMGKVIKLDGEDFRIKNEL